MAKKHRTPGEIPKYALLNGYDTPYRVATKPDNIRNGWEDQMDHSKPYVLYYDWINEKHLVYHPKQLMEFIINEVGNKVRLIDELCILEEMGDIEFVECDEFGGWDINLATSVRTIDHCPMHHGDLLYEQWRTFELQRMIYYSDVKRPSWYKITKANRPLPPGRAEEKSDKLNIISDEELGITVNETGKKKKKGGNKPTVMDRVRAKYRAMGIKIK